MTPDELRAAIEAAGAKGFRVPNTPAAVLAAYKLVKIGAVEQTDADPWTLRARGVPEAKSTTPATFRLARSMVAHGGKRR